MEPREALVIELAGAVLDGAPIDWAAVESEAGQADRALIEQLRVMATLAHLHRHPRLSDARTPLADPDSFLSYLRDALSPRSGRGEGTANGSAIVDLSAERLVSIA